MDEREARRVGRLLRCARLVRGGLRQSEVAAAAGLTTGSLSRLETAHPRAPRLTAELLGRLADALQIYPEALMPKPPPWHGMRMVRGRINTHFLALGEWPRLAEVVEHCLVELHRFRPDIVGLSLLVLGHFGQLAPISCDAAIDGGPPGERDLDWNDERVRRGQALARSRHRGTWWNRLPPRDAVIPGCALSRAVIETSGGPCSLWFAFVEAPPPLGEDPELLTPDRRQSLLWHVGDTVAQALDRLRDVLAGPRVSADEMRHVVARLEHLERAVDGTVPT